MPSVTPRSRKISEIKKDILHPALTSQFQVYVGKPSMDDGFQTFLDESGCDWTPSKHQDRILN